MKKLFIFAALILTFCLAASGLSFAASGDEATTAVSASSKANQTSEKKQSEASSEAESSAKKSSAGSKDAESSTKGSEKESLTLSNEAERKKDTLKDGSSFFVVGNPDCYPFEYYDSESGTYKGILPAILKDIAERNNLTFLYFNIDVSRDDLAENSQGELISTCIDDEFSEFPRTEPIFSFESSDGSESSVSIAFSDAAGEDLIALIEKELSDLSASKKLDYYYSFALAERNKDNNTALIIIISVLSAIIALIIILGVIYIKKLKNKAKYALGTNFVLTSSGIKEYFDSNIKDAVRNLYDVIFISCRFSTEDADTDDLRRRFAEIIRGCFSSDEKIGFMHTGFCLISNSEKTNAAELIAAVEAGRRAEADKLKTAKNSVHYGLLRLSKSDRQFNSAVGKAVQAAEYAERHNRLSVDYNAGTDDLDSVDLFTADVLRKGLEGGEFKAVYQPVFDASTGKLAMFEAFSRWESQSFGYVEESVFREHFHRNGMIAELDLAVFAECVRRLRYRAKVGKMNIPLICNFSRRSLLSEGFVENVLEIIRKSGADASNIIFEIRAKDRKVDLASLAEVTDRLRANSISISIDIAGTGAIHFEDYSHLRVDYLKIDGSILSYLGKNEVTLLVLKLVSFLRDVDVKLICNDVSSKKLFDMAVNIGADYLEGDYCYGVTDIAGAEKLLDT